MVHVPGGIASMYGDSPSRSRRAPRRLSPSRCAPQHPPIEARRADGHQRQCVPRETWTRALTEDGYHATDEPSRVLTSDPVVSWTSFRSVSHVPSCVAHRALRTRACRGVSQGKSFSASHMIAVCPGTTDSGQDPEFVGVIGVRFLLRFLGQPSRMDDRRRPSPS